MKPLMNYRYLLTLFVFSLIILFSSQPANFFYTNVEVGSSVRNDIVAPRTATYIDEKATEELKVQTLKETKSVYDKDLTIQEKQKEDLTTFFESINEAKNVAIIDDKKSPTDSIVNVYNLPQNELELFLQISNDNLSNAEDYLKNKLGKIYTAGVRDENLKQVQEELKNDSNLYLFTPVIRDVLIEKISSNLKVNEVLNKEETEKQKEKTLATVTPVYKKIIKGELIVSEETDSVITEEHMKKLEALGLVNQEFKWGDFFRHYPNILLFLILFHFYCSRFVPDKINSMRKYVFTLFIVSFVTFLSQMLQGAFWFFIPFITSLIVFAVFWGRKFVIAASILIGFLINGDDYINMLLSLIIGLSLSFVYTDFRRFTDAIKTGTLIGGIVGVSSFILYFSFEQRVTFEELGSLIFAGLLSGIIANGIIPLIENVLGMATIYKLTELNKYDHPILEQLYRNAKGTYEHSRNVGHLCSSASRKIGTNTLLLKVAALYHDLGKIDKPEYFIENSHPEKNAHDNLTPLESAQIILAHPSRSVELCRKYSIPQEVIDLIHSHHSNSVLYHFYQKALEQGMDVTIDDFRYKTPTPKTKEQGILLLADSTEAYSRSLEFETIEDLGKTIRKFIYKKVEEGNLIDCELSTKDIEICIEEFTSAIFATQHKRVKYVTDKVKD